MRTKARATRATVGKLERALIALESFADSDNIEQTISYTEQLELARSIDTIRRIESNLLNRTEPGR